MHLYLRVRKRDRVGQLPTQMTREFHPLSQIQKSALTTKTGCQGDPLYLSIKGTPCEDYSDLENKQRIRSGNTGIWASEKTTQKQESLNKNGTINMFHTAPCQSPTQKQTHHLEHTKLDQEWLQKEKCGHTVTYRLAWFCQSSKSHEEGACRPLSPPCWPLPTSCCQLAPFNNGSQVIRRLSHTLFTCSRTGRLLGLIRIIYPS